MNALLFDMDGVLVDVAQSYRLAIKKTVEFFDGDNVSLAEIQEYKNRGGLNNDWDLTETILRERNCRARKNKIIEVFQRYYLGAHYDGLILDEKWLFKRDFMNILCADFPLGIVTGRPREEAEFVLGRFGVTGYFASLITMQDVPPGRGKPDPLGLQLALQALRAHGGWYFGDTVDDMRAARAADLIAVGVAPSPEESGMADLLRSHGAHTVLSTVNNIMEIFR